MSAPRILILPIGLLGLAPFAHSHMIMATPQPFGSPDNSPLDPSGSDYPCKIISSMAGPGPTNNWSVGSIQELSFSGSVVHGGGSCQIAVTTDKNPTRQSSFKVIHSIEGGCPGVGSPDTFGFKVPDLLPDGDLVVAWTWFNRIGNREMYMNCANVKVTGGAPETSKLEKLPNMALANIGVAPGTFCKTKEGFDYTFPGVGQNDDTVDRVGAGPFIELCGNEASATHNPDISSSSDTNIPTESNDSVYNTGFNADNDAVTSGTSQTSAAPVSADLVSAPASATFAATAGSDAGPDTCSYNGAMFCNGERQFGLCSNDMIIWQNVAAGTKCEHNKIVRCDFTASSALYFNNTIT
ncbi:hypothetical protein GRF29_8g2553950 [Pseudopithomyces chartarum]|uniref:Carbohydrate-binding module family 19 domain-containing protein n=1 Tax=Pseudopithomyces chartarum TaxID=1892770 RepID=A0AAN6M7V3_9PLEO|nr:hypothetical protein GRF29_8g2553950 [Pseudopithomyces chartarum]